MKTITNIIFLITALSSSLYAQQGMNKSTPLTGPYLGQKLPGAVPEVFAPGIVSTDAHEFSCCFSPDGRELYFSRRHPGLNETVVMVSKQVNGVWSEPEVAPFVEKHFSFEPFVTPDNERLYFQSMKIAEGKPDMATLFVNRNDTGWSKINDPGAPFNPGKTMHISATAEGTIYTTDISGGMGNEVLGIIRKVNGEYQKLEPLGSPLNREKKSQHPWIAPDESYILFTVRRPGQNPVSVLLVSFKNKNGEWTEPIELKPGMDAGQPFVTYDRKYLFFTSGDPRKGSDIYWVSAKIIDELRPKK